MPLYIVRDDIANMRTDAIVVPANSALRIDGGAGEAVARLAGAEALQAACDSIGGCAVGDAVITPAFDFPAKMIVHAVGPVWMGGFSGEAAALAAGVTRALEAAFATGAESVALPLLSTGVFGYPMGEAIDVETRAIQAFLEDHEVDVWLVLYDRQSMRMGREMFDAIAEYIDDVYVDEREQAEASYRASGASRGWSHVGYPASPDLSGAAAPAPLSEAFLSESAGNDRGGIIRRLRHRRGKRQEGLNEELSPDAAAEEDVTVASASFDAALFEGEMAPAFASAAPAHLNAPAPTDATQQSLADRLDSLDESFACTVLRLIDERGMTDVEVYKRANMSRQLFAKIRKDDDYRPTKRTACALAFALELSHEDALALLSRAGFALSHSSKFDVIVEFFLMNGIHNIFQVNEALFAYDQPILG